MNIFDTSIPQELHHFYIVEGFDQSLKDDLMEFLIERNITTINNPNILIENYNSLTVEKSTLLRNFHSEKATNEGAKIFIITTFDINREAGNALLKMFEEPTPDTYFFLFLPKVSIVLPTLLSRAQIIKSNKEAKPISLKEAEIFIKNSKEDRIISITKIIAKHKDVDGSATLRDEARNFLDGCEYIIRKNNKELGKDLIWKLEELIKARKYLSTNGASVKMILEHIALVI